NMQYEVIGHPPNVSVPTHFYKVIPAIKGSNSPFSIGAFAMPNEALDNSALLTNISMLLETIEKAAGIVFFEKVDREVGKVVTLCSIIDCKLQMN
ncbi:nuclease, partial [Podila verticillata]